MLRASSQAMRFPRGLISCSQRPLVALPVSSAARASGAGAAEQRRSESRERGAFSRRELDPEEMIEESN